MAQELFFTSAERGLQIGSRGYCTVARTAKMRRGLVARLEEISAFRPHFSGDDPRANENPIVVSHVRVTADGQPVTVLSRIASAAPDYSGRTNYLAHHVVVDPSERSQAGPVWTAMQANVLARSWDGQVREIPTTRAMPHGNTTPGICHAWERMTRDAGWGGVLAEHLANKTTQPFYLVYEPGQDLLPLLAEAVALLPPSRRWDVTFSTYYTGARGNMSCAVRGVVRGSEEAALARGSAHLDLANLGGRTPPDSMWAEAARTGVAIGTLATPAMSGAPRILGGLAGPGIEPPNITGRGRPPVHAPADLPTPASRAYVDDDDDLVPPPPPSSGSKWIWITSGIALGLLILAGGIALVMNLDGLKGDPQLAKNQAKPAETKPAEPGPKEGKEEKPKDKPAEPSKDKGKKPAGAGADTAKVDETPQPTPPKKPEGTGEANKVDATLPEPPVDAAVHKAKMVEMQGKLNAANEAKKTAETAAEAARNEAQKHKDELAKLKGDGVAMIPGRKSKAIQLSQSGKQPENEPLAFAISPTELFLVRKLGAPPAEDKIVEGLTVTWKSQQFRDNNKTEFEINAQSKPGSTSAEDYFTIVFQAELSPTDTKKNQTKITLKCANPKTDKDKEIRKAFIDYLLQHQLVVIEPQRASQQSGQQAYYRGTPRITVFDFEEEK